MNDASILVLAAGLALDSAAVAAARAVAVPRLRAADVLVVACFFGGAHVVMPALGWIAGRELGALVAAWDHWLAFALLAGIGAHMLGSARAGGARPGGHERGALAPRVLAALAFATSIDAFAAGLALPLVDAPFASSIATIGAVAAAASVAGLYLGRRSGAALGRRLELAGGLVLVGLGVKVLIEHLADHGLRR